MIAINAMVIVANVRGGVASARKERVGKIPELS